MEKKEILFKLDNGKEFDAVFETSENKTGYCAIIAHGANNDMNNDLLVILSKTLINKGVDVLKFNFPYRYEGRKSPDTPGNLKKTWERVYSFVKDEKGCLDSKIITMGKSLGGRICSEAIAEKRFEPCLMVFLGYPLHAPGKRDRLKDSHLYNMDIPLIFVSGTKDPLADFSSLANVCLKIGERAQIIKVDEAGHSLAPKGLSENDKNIHYGKLSDKLWNQITKKIDL